MVNIIEPAEVLQILSGYNPWWSQGTWKTPNFKRIAYQVCIDYLKQKSFRRAIHLSGPRRVGKTTILAQIAEYLIQNGEDPKSICYLSLDHPLLKMLSLPKILKIYTDNIRTQGSPAVLLLDEVQYSSDWDLHIKQLVDHHPQYRILATGSANVENHQKISESGVGRWVTVQIPTLSFYEFLRIRDEKTPNISPQLRPMDLFAMKQGERALLADQLRMLLPLFQRYLVVGGFPETARSEDSLQCQRLLREDVVERVLKRDMASLFRIRNINDLEKLFIYLCLNSGGIFSYAACGSALETDAKTVANHLTALERANLIYSLKPYRLGGKKILKAQPKIYLVDAALANAVLLQGDEILRRPEEMGGIVETTVLRHLFAYYYRDIPEISYWRDAASGKEVDIIVKSPAYLIPVEVKYRSRAALTARDGMVTFCRSEKPKYGYWVTQESEDFDLQQVEGADTQILRIPAHIFIFLLGQAERLLWNIPAPEAG